MAVSETAELKNRVENAIQRLTAGQEERRRSNQTLSQVLAGLEAKYNARGDELRQCHARIRELAESNERLAGLLERIVGIIETHADDSGDAAIRRAADTARDIVQSWGGDPAADAPDAPAAPAVPAARTASAQHAKAAALPPMRFEDVSDEELTAELIAEEAEQARASGDGVDMAQLADVAALDAPVPEPDANQEVVQLDETDAVAEIAAEPAQVEEVDAIDATPTADARAPAAPGAPVFDEVEVVEDVSDEADAGEIEFEPAEAETEEIETEAVEIDMPAPPPSAAPAHRPPAAGAREIGRDDIRAMLDRLERAAARAQAFAEQQGRAPGGGKGPHGKERVG